MLIGFEWPTEKCCSISSSYHMKLSKFSMETSGQIESVPGHRFFKLFHFEDTEDSMPPKIRPSCFGAIREKVP